MKKLFITAALLMTSQAFAHQGQDWRDDYEAFISIRYELPGSYTRSTRPASRTSRVDMNFFKEKLKILTDTADRRSEANRVITRNYLKAEYESIGFKTSTQTFGGGANFIAEKPGTVSPEKVLVLSSHIDTVRTKGANDNGTGTIGLLAVAQELAKHSYPFTVRVLGFDREEVGLVGSDAYVAIIPKTESIIGNINFEMMGYNSRKDGAFHVIDCDKPTSKVLSDSIKTSIADLGLRLNVVNTCTDRSDHASFWRKNLPAIVISENFFGGDGDPCYHAKCDIMDERLDYEYMGHILEAVLDTTEKLLQK